MKGQKVKSDVRPATQQKPELVFPVNYYLAAACAILAFLLYMNTIGHDYVLDDSAAIKNNLYVQEGFKGIPKLLTIDFWHFSGLRLGYYRPLPLITFAVEYQFFGLNPHVSHAGNVVLYSMAVFFVFLLTSRLFNRKNPMFALIIALLFAAHPVHTEVVANIKSRDELLGFLNIAAMLFFTLRYAETRKILPLVFGLLFFYLALLSKESALVSILLIPLFLWFRGFREPAGLFRLLLPYLAAIAVYFIQKKILFETETLNIPNDIVNYPYSDKAVKYSSLFMLFLFFLRVLVFPHPLRYDYSYNQLPAVTWDNPLALTGLVLFTAICIYAVLQIRKGTGMGLALGFFLITLAPSMGFIILRGGIFAERFLFAPSLGYVMVIALLLEKLLKTSFSGPLSFRKIPAKHLAVLFPAVLVVTVAYGAKTVTRNGAWKDKYTLYSTDINTGKESAQNNLHLGTYWLAEAYNEKDREKQAIMINEGMKPLSQAIRVLPTFGDAFFWIAYAYELRASSQDIRNVDTAIYYFNMAATYAPSFYEVYIHLGDIYKWMGNKEAASFYFNEAVRYNPVSVVAVEKANRFRSETGLDVRVNPLLKSNQVNPVRRF